MRPVRPRRFESRPSAKTARPIKPTHFRAAHERRILNRLMPRPRAARTPIIRNPRLGAASRADQNDETLRIANELRERHRFAETHDVRLRLRPTYRSESKPGIRPASLFLRRRECEANRYFGHVRG